MQKRNAQHDFDDTRLTSIDPEPVHETTDQLVDFQLNRRQKIIRGALHLFYSIAPTRAAKLASFLFRRPRRKPITYTWHLPVGAEDIHVYHNLQKLVGYSWGDGDKTIVMVHGWESHLGRMLPLVRPLVNAGFRVVAFDGPGHGQSPQLLTNMYDFGEAVRCAIEQQSPYAVIANSFGAAATTTMLSRQPELQPEKLVLVSPMGHFEHHLAIFNRLVGIDGELEKAMRHQIETKLPRPIAHFDVAQAVKTLNVPGLVIHDLYDPIIPFESSLQVASNWVQGEFKETRHLGHKNVIGNADIQAIITRFLVEGNVLDSVINDNDQYDDAIQQAS